MHQKFDRLILVRTQNPDYVDILRALEHRKPAEFVR
jgi:hypothetical protein